MNREELMIVYNSGTDLEFAECGKCGFEMDRKQYNYPPVYFKLEASLVRCPRCGQWMHPVKAEDVK